MNRPTLQTSHRSACSVNVDFDNMPEQVTTAAGIAPYLATALDVRARSRALPNETPKDDPRIIELRETFRNGRVRMLSNALSDVREFAWRKRAKTPADFDAEAVVEAAMPAFRAALLAPALASVEARVAAGRAAAKAVISEALLAAQVAAIHAERIRRRRVDPSWGA